MGDQVKAPPQAQVIDATNTIVIPGFVDAHRHSWEGQLRRIIPDGAISDYMATTHNGFARYYRPHDIYVGNLITALGCIDAGITCMIDNSHNSRSAAHSDAAVQALIDSGIRGVHASGAPQTGEWDRQWPQDLERLQKRFFTSTDQLVTLRMFSGMSRENWALARRLGIRITTESNAAGPEFEQFWKEKLLRSDNTFNHCQGWPDQVWQRVKEAGATVNVCPRSDAQYGLGEGVSAFQKALDHGMRPGFSIDNEVSYGTDMFTEMRVAFNVQRAMATYRRANGDAKAPAPVSVRAGARVRNGRRRRLRRAARQMRNAHAGQGSGHRHDPDRRHQPVSVQSCDRDRRGGGGRTEHRHGDRRRPDTEAPRPDDGREHGEVPPDGR